MKRLLLCGAALLMTSTVAFAGSTNTSSNATSGSTSHAAAAAGVNNLQNISPTSTSAAGLINSTSPTQNVGNTFNTTTPSNTSSTSRVNNNVDAQSPTIYGGTNPCGSGASAAASFLGMGFSGGVNNELQTCTDRAWFVLMMTASKEMKNDHFAQWGVNIACLNERVAKSAPPGMCGQANAPAQVSSVPAATSSAAPMKPPVARIQPPVVVEKPLSGQSSNYYTNWYNYHQNNN